MSQTVRAILFAPINFYGAGVAQLDRHDARRRVGAEEQLIILESHRLNDCTAWLPFRAA